MNLLYFNCLLSSDTTVAHLKWLFTDALQERILKLKIICNPIVVVRQYAGILKFVSEMSFSNENNSSKMSLGLKYLILMGSGISAILNQIHLKTN